MTVAEAVAEVVVGFLPVKFGVHIISVVYRLLQITYYIQVLVLSNY